MSKIAKQLSKTPPSSERIRRGPNNACHGVYEADIEDWEAIEAFRHRPGESWATAQRFIDGLLGYTYPAIPNDKFRYHWRRRCFCWPDEHRLS